MLVELASTPVAAGLFFLYIKDKYEKEPWKMLFLGVLFGLYTAAVVYALGSFLEERFPHEETPFYTAFFSSAGAMTALGYQVEDGRALSEEDSKAIVIGGGVEFYNPKLSWEMRNASEPPQVDVLNEKLGVTWDWSYGTRDQLTCTK